MIAINSDHNGSTGREILNGVMDFALHHPGARWKVVAYPWRVDFGQPIDGVPLEGLITHVWRTGREFADVQRVLDANVPTVLVGTAPIPGFDAPAVLVDDDAIGRAAAEYFLSRGYRHFAFAGAVRQGESFDDRLAGYAAALQAKGYNVSVFGGHPCTLPPRVVMGPGDMISWLREMAKPAAIFCAKDSIAHMVTTAASAAKIAVPDQLSILGVDNDGDYHYENGGISSVAPPFRQVGFRGAELLDEMLNGQVPARITRISSNEIITRSSSDAVALRDADVVDAVRYIRENAREGIVVEDVLAKIPLSRRTLERRFQAALGITPKEEIQRVRVEQAKHLLSKSALSIQEIALATGFSHRSRLFEAFKAGTGMSPQEYRTALQGDEHGGF